MQKTSEIKHLIFHSLTLLIVVVLPGLDRRRSDIWNGDSDLRRAPNSAPWYISMFKPIPVIRGAHYPSPPGDTDRDLGGPVPPRRSMRTVLTPVDHVQEECEVASGSGGSMSMLLKPRMLEVTTKGNVGAAFQVPDGISVSGDGLDHC